MPTTTLKRWGNSQGVIISKAVCDAAHLDLDDTMDIRVDSTSGIIVLSPVRRRYHREGKVSARELFEGWGRNYEVPADLVGEGQVGNEADWGGRAGREMW